VAWNDVPPDYQNELIDLVNQYNQITGYGKSQYVTPKDPNFMAQLAAANITDIQQLGEWLWGHGYGDVHQPWSEWGMTFQQYYNRFNSLQSAVEQLIGPANLGPYWDWFTNTAISNALLYNLSPSDLAIQIKDSPLWRKWFPWLNYGLDWAQFQQNITQMKPLFGRELTTAEAINQLQYLHTAQGADMSVRTQQTLTQVERQQAVVGASQSQVR
jgi:hypothetical protein